MASISGGTGPAEIASAIASGGAVISTENSTTTLLTAGASFTGTWQLCTGYDSVVVAVKSDQNGTYSVQFSPDGSNQDSTLTRYYRTDQIEAPHRFTVTRAYFRVVFTNTSASDQTYIRLQTIMGTKTALNAPMDSTLAQDFDALPTRPSDYTTEVALGLRQGVALWHMWGYNLDIDTGATEVIAPWGGTYAPMATARTLSIVSTSTADANGSTGANNVVVYGIDADRAAQTVVVTMNGTTPVVTTETWLGVNRIAVGLAGSGQANAGTITATATTDLTIQGQVATGAGASQECLLHIRAGHTALIENIKTTVIRTGGGSEPTVTVYGWVFSPVSNCQYEVYRVVVDASLDNASISAFTSPLVVEGPAIFYLTASTTLDNTSVNCRFVAKEVRKAAT